jgi:predicted RNA-binding protein associated with RNAse of E/G family
MELLAETEAGIITIQEKADAYHAKMEQLLAHLREKRKPPERR